MPTYEYRCSSCGRTFEVVQSFSDAPLTICEVCAGELKRVFHPVGIVLKGSGFYSTDNRGGKSLTPGKKDDAKGESSSDGGGSSSGSGDSGGSRDSRGSGGSGDSGGSGGSGGAGKGAGKKTGTKKADSGSAAS